MTGKTSKLSYFAIPLGILLVSSPLLSCRDTKAPPDSPEIRQAKELLHEARNIADALDDSAESSVSASRAWALTQIAVLQADIADYPGAFATVKMLKEDFAKDYALASISATQAARDDVAGALTTIADLRESSVQQSAREKICAAQVRAGDVGEAVDTAMQNGFSRERALRIAAREQARSGDLSGAIRTAKKIGQGLARDYALSEVAQVQAGAGDIAGALAIADTIDSLDAHAAAMWSVVLAQAENGNVKAALQAAQSAPALGNERDRALASIAKAQAKTGMFDQALNTIKKIRSEGDRGTALGHISAAQARAGDSAGALETLRRIADEHARLQAFQVVLQSQAERGLFGDELSTAAAEEFTEFRGDAQGYVAVALALGGDAPKALEVFHKAKLPDNTSSTSFVLGIAQAQASSGDVPGALAWVRQLPSPQERVAGLVGVAMGIIGNKKSSSILNLLSQ